MEMEDQYGIADLRQLISRAAATGGHPYPVPPYPPHPPPELFSSGGGQYEMVVMGRHVNPESNTTSGGPEILMFNNNHQHVPSRAGGFQHHHNHQQVDQMKCDSSTTTATVGGFDGGDGGTARWPRQETLTLLEIRSRLHHKFKEANQKGPLWDEVARIMSEEHGYQRSGKKCREKFENLYKYYKKTKEGKAGRQDGKHYRFFRQLEALYGSSSTSDDAHISQNTPQFHNNPISPQPINLHSYPLHNPQHPRGGLCDTSVSLSNSSDFDPSSSDGDDNQDDCDLNGGEPSMESNGSREKKGKKRRSNWKGKIKEFIDLQMRKIMDKQEAWLEKVMKTLEGREQERMLREEEWRRRQEEARVEREHKFWECERAWIESRDSALMKALDKLTHTAAGSSSGSGSGSGSCAGGIARMDQWPETEITRLIQLRTNMESRLQQCGISEEVLWEDIATKMAYFGYERSAIVCKEKWDSINKEFIEKGNNSRKRKEEYTSYGVSNLNEGGLYMNQLNGFNNCEI